MGAKNLTNTGDVSAWEHGFCQLAEAIGAVFRVSDAEKGQTLYISPGYEEIWGRTCEDARKSDRAWLEAIHPEDSDRMFGSSVRVGKNGGYDEEYRIVRPDGTLRWVRERAFGIRNEAGELERVASITEDITERKRLEKEVIEINDRERSQLGRDLHDGICQQLVSIAFATDLLRRDLQAKSPGEAVRAEKITGLLDSAISQARNLSQALSPVNLAGDGLAVALRSLAGTVNQGSGVVCGVDCSEQVFIEDHALATHLYRIAQEAVRNAIKHSHPTQVLVRLEEDGHTVRLSISENGNHADADNESKFEVGLSVINFRAKMAGARMKVEKISSGGTLIECAVRQVASEERRMPEADLQLLVAKA